jgi:anti-sigma factor RsiW
MTCGDARVMAMGLADGETEGVSREEVERHLAECSACQEELVTLAAIDRIWGSFTRRRPDADLWAVVERRLAERWRRWLTALGVVLVSFRCMELFPDWELGLWTELVPLAAVVGAFIILRLNPFQISTDLQLSQEEQ